MLACLHARVRVCELFGFGKVPQGESIDSAAEVSADCMRLCACVCVWQLFICVSRPMETRCQIRLGRKVKLKKKKRKGEADELKAKCP